MDAQLKRGFLEACVLASVRDAPLWGYRILDEVPTVLGLSQSTLYPILRRLEKAGFIKSRSQESNGRLRKYYSITPKGVRRLRQYQDDWRQIQEIYDFIDQKV